VQIKGVKSFLGMRGEVVRCPSFYFALAVVAGILFGRTYPFTPFSVLLLAAVVVLMVTFALIPKGLKPLIVLFALLGFCSMQVTLASLVSPSNIGRLAPIQDASLEGLVKGPIDYFPKGFRFRLAVEKVDGRASSGLANVGVYFHGDAPLPGDRFRLNDVYLKPVIGFHNFDGFNKEEYLKDLGITAQVNIYHQRQLSVIAKASAWRLDAACEKLRKYIHVFIKKEYPNDVADIAAAMTIGVRGGMSSKEKKNYSVSGLSHLLAVAGLHVGFISGFAYMVFYLTCFYALYFIKPFWLQIGVHRKMAACFVILTILVYVLVTGANVPARRAGIMAGVFFLSIILEREGEIFNSLFIASILILLPDPQALFSFSFLMSFTAVAAIALLLKWDMNKPEHETVQANRPEWIQNIVRFFEETIKISLVLAVATAPLLMTWFNEVHAEGVLANIIAVPIAMFAIPSVFISAIFGAVWVPLGTVAAWFSSVGFSGIDFTARFFGSSTIFSFYGPSPSIWLIALFYFVFLLWANRSRFFGATAFILFVAVIIFYWPVERRFSEIRFIDVGQGDATLMMFKDGSNVLVDGGMKFMESDLGELVVIPELRRLGIKKLDAVIATHGDMDHVGGLFAVLRNIKVGKYMDNGEPHPALEGLRKIAQEFDIPRFALHAGMDIPVTASAVIKVLHPSNVFVESHPNSKNNDISLMIMVTAEGHKTLLTADCEHISEGYLLEQNTPLKADILKVGHHGSASSTTPEFLKEVSPAIAVISVGKLNRYKMPASQTMETLGSMPGLKVYQTQNDGDVSIIFRERKIYLKTYFEPKAVLVGGGGH
jgi:competence protein ComEC